ncbi:sterile alpha motif domain-containing protein 7 isoform X2 [Denticeps clupeoides]|uniref:sterile alpha motif domain-containing protein 7 isoform X2 n=1 Tax=Denticeps clupeoides TaxID=299321 RepID=UPI0010A2FB73|nr:sterile alpha motif domain-containing protein 7 isoform X2 [Denticeps clupeoides]
MTPREQLRKMTALGEQGSLEEKHWYRLVNGMSAGGKRRNMTYFHIEQLGHLPTGGERGDTGGDTGGAACAARSARGQFASRQMISVGLFVAELRQRQELMMRNQMAMAPQILAQGQQRLQGVPAQFEPRFMERELVPPPEMVSSDARQMHMGAHLGPPLPPHSNVIPGRGFPGAAGYSFLPSEPMETVARRQELIHKQNIARMEMNAILHQKELENAQQKGLMGMDNPMMYPGIQSSPMGFQRRQRLPDGHDVFVHRTTLEDLQANSLLMSASPYPPISSLQRERGRRPGRRAANHKNADSTAPGSKAQAEEKNVEQSPGGASGEEKDADGKGDLGGEGPVSKTHSAKMDTELLSGSGRKSYKEGEHGLRKACVRSQDGCPDGTNCSSGASDKDAANPCSAFHEKMMYPSAAGPFSGLPYMIPVPGNGLLPPEEMSSLEDIRKWTVEDVYNFINDVTSCSEYAQTFKDHMIDGETLPLITEEHLLDTFGLKLGPALKIRSQVSRRLGSMFYMMNMHLSASAAQPPSEKAGDRSSEVSSPLNSVELLGSPCTRDAEGLKPAEPTLEAENPPTPTSETA